MVHETNSVQQHQTTLRCVWPGDPFGYPALLPGSALSPAAIPLPRNLKPELAGSAA